MNGYHYLLTLPLQHFLFSPEFLCLLAFVSFFYKSLLEIRNFTRCYLLARDVVEGYSILINLKKYKMAIVSNCEQL